MCLLRFQGCSKLQSYTHKTMESVREVTSVCTVYGCESHRQSPIQASLQPRAPTPWLVLPLKGSHSQRATSPWPAPGHLQSSRSHASLCCPAPALPLGCHLQVSTVPLLRTRDTGARPTERLREEGEEETTCGQLVPLPV